LEDLLRECQNNSSLKPNVHCFTTVLKAWSNSRDPQAPEHAKAFLKRMTDYHVQPNVVSYSTVLDAWAKSSHSQAPNRAQAMLNYMRSSSRLSPNAISGTTVMKALPNPDFYSFSTVLYAWSKSQLPNAAEQAERLLVRMQELYDENLMAHPPNVICYSNVLACWAHSGVPGAAQRALDILRAMQQLQPGVSPNRISYNTVMNAWANEARRNDDAVHQVQALLEELEQLSQTDPQLMPVDAISDRIGSHEKEEALNCASSDPAEALVCCLLFGTMAQPMDGLALFQKVASTIKHLGFGSIVNVTGVVDSFLRLSRSFKITNQPGHDLKSETSTSNRQEEAARQQQPWFVRSEMWAREEEEASVCRSIMFMIFYDTHPDQPAKDPDPLTRRLHLILIDSRSVVLVSRT
jgi:hypothetical protein